MRRTTSTCRRMCSWPSARRAPRRPSAPAPPSGSSPSRTSPNIRQRSGLLDRFDPIEPHLPHDKDRDNFYITRWGDKDKVHRPNNIKNGGLYGRFWKAECTACASPSSSGEVPARARSARIAGGSTSPRAWSGTWFHPFRPVCMHSCGSWPPRARLRPAPARPRRRPLSLRGLPERTRGGLIPTPAGIPPGRPSPHSLG